MENTLAEIILEGLSRQSFIEWHESTFDAFISGDEPEVSREKVLDDIRRIFKLDSLKQPSKIKSCMVPEMRLRHIARRMESITDDKKKGLSKMELVNLLVADGLSANTASVYISGASGAGVIERTEYGYCLTKAGRELL